MVSGYKRIYDSEEEQEILIQKLSWKRLHQCNAKLASTSGMASLMSFFSVISAVELKLVEGETSEGLIIALVITTSALVALTMIVKTVTCSLIPYLESVSSVSAIQDVTRSPHEVMIRLINVTWLVGTVFLPGLFLADFIIMAWIKFSFFSIEAVYAATLILSPLLIIILGFGFVFLKQTIKPDKACIDLSRKNSLRQSNASLSPSTTTDSSTVSSSYCQETQMLLPASQFPHFTSYGSTVPTLDSISLLHFCFE